MLEADPEVAQSLLGAVYTSAGREIVRQSVTDIYANLQRAIDLRRPLCTASGRCCRFEEFGHRLYVTTMELATFVYELEIGSWGDSLAASRRAWKGTGCPFQAGGLCGVHPIRPFGCRIFFCDSTSTDWQREQYEQFHNDLKKLHATLSVPYYYVEWRWALKVLNLLHTEPA
ncbi:MAG TPA: hypothetical protein VHS31_10820 [Tepidisphaeraceae bacterium]|nr:hypothetical protein [Tepidisphaeraceae bacterium]